MKIYIGADYRGRELKNKIIDYLLSKKIDVIDVYVSDKEVDDYTDYSFMLGEKVREDNGSFGILICGSGSGVCIAANKVRGIRCIRAASVLDAHLGRDHDNANVLALGSEVTTDFNLIKEIIDTFVNTPFPNLDRRLRRIDKILKYEVEN